jgi:hypothetical protein
VPGEVSAAQTEAARAAAWHRHRFVDTAAQYYVLGRYAVFCCYLPTAGNLFHHAVEFMLKYRLLDQYSERDLRKPPFGHGLLRLSKEFKLLVGDRTLGRYL